MDKVFLNVLHEEEKIENESLEMLKGGQGSGCGSTNICDKDCKPNICGSDH